LPTCRGRCPSPPRVPTRRSSDLPAGGVAEQPALFGEAAQLEARPLFGRVLGQVQDTFVVSASDDEVFFLDQHVAHERVIFEGLRDRKSTRLNSSHGSISYAVFCV